MIFRSFAEIFIYQLLMTALIMMWHSLRICLRSENVKIRLQGTDVYFAFQ